MSKPRRAMKTLIIIPTYNERENLPLLLRQIFLHAPATDVLIVDDNSPDGTGKLAEGLAQENHQIHVLHRSAKLGLGTAYIAGFKYAISHDYDAAFEMDADFSHDPRHLPDFLTAIERADLVIGSRYIPGGYAELVGDPPDQQQRQYLRPCCPRHPGPRLHRRISLLSPARPPEPRPGCDPIAGVRF